MSRNKSTFERMVLSVKGSYLAPLKDGKIDFSKTVHVEGPAFLKRKIYPVKLESVNDEEYIEGEVVASVKYPSEHLLWGYMRVKDFVNYISLSDEQVFSNFPSERPQTPRKCTKMTDEEEYAEASIRG